MLSILKCIIKCPRPSNYSTILLSHILSISRWHIYILEPHTRRTQCNAGRRQLTHSPGDPTWPHIAAAAARRTSESGLASGGSRWPPTSGAGTFFLDLVYSLSQKYRRSTWVESLRAPGWGIGEGPSKAGGAVAADRATAARRTSCHGWRRVAAPGQSFLRI